MMRTSARLAATLIVALGACTEANPTAVYSETGAIIRPDSGRADGPLIPDDGAVNRDLPRHPGDGAPPPPDQGTQPKCTAPANRALRLFFIGNSFTLGGPIPSLVKQLAAGAGWPTPEVEYSAYGGYTLAQHRGTSSSVNGVAKGSWDFVVLQEYSTKPTDNMGDPKGFKEDATWWYEQTKAKSKNGWVVLYETWARHKDHSVYPGSFKDPAEMQAQLRKHYNDAADNYIPKNAKAAPRNHVKVAPCGDAWEKHLNGPSPLRLHGTDNYHAGARGAYLNAAVIYSTLYGCRAKGLDSLGLSSADAARLQDSADATTGQKGIPPGPPPGVLPVGTKVLIDFGSLPTSSGHWNNVTSASGSLKDAVSSSGAATSLDLVMTDNFSGGNTSGIANNKLGLPSTVSRDNLYGGSSSNHAEGLKNPGEFELRGLPAGTYSLSFFNSRQGKDGSLDRLTRFTVGGAYKDLDAADNVDKVASFSNVAVGSDGKLTVTVAVSPAGTGRYCYINALQLERTK